MAQPTPAATAQPLHPSLWEAAFETIKTSNDFSDKWKKCEKYLGAQGHPSSRATISATDLAQRLDHIRDETRKHGFEEAFVSIGGAIQATKDVGDAIAALNPYASLAWSIFHFVLQAGIAVPETKQACRVHLSRLATLTGKYQTLEDIFVTPSATSQARPYMEQSVTRLYTAILQYQLQVVVFFGSRWAKLKRLAGLPSDLEESISSVESSEAEVSNNLAIIAKEISDRNFAEVKTSLGSVQNSLTEFTKVISSSLHTLERVATSLNQQEASAVMDWISTYRHADTHMRDNKRPLPGTCNWLLADDKFKDWCLPKKTSTLWLCGGLGVGKTCLTHCVIQYAKTILKPSDNDKLAYVYCSNTDRSTQVEFSYCERLLGSLLRQLAAKDPDGQEPYKIHTQVLQNVMARRNDQSRFSSEQCTELLRQVVRDSKGTFIIIDAFDELGGSVQNELTLQLQELTRENTVHLFISGGHAAKEYMRQLHAETIDISSRPPDDIRLYIRHMAERAAKDPKTARFYHGDKGKALQQEVASIVQQHTGDMFRWAQLAFALLAEAETSLDLRVRLRELPTLNSLFNIYDQIWKEKVLSRSKPSVVAIETTLLFTMYESPLHKELLFYAMLYRDLDDISRNRYIATAAGFASSNDTDAELSVQEIVDMCPELLVIDSAEFQAAHCGVIDADLPCGTKRRKDSLILPHASVWEFLRVKYPAQFGEIAAHRSLLEVCVRIWNELPPESPPKGSKLTDWTTISSLQVYSTLYWMDHFQDHSGFVESILDSMRKDPMFRKLILNLLGTANPQIASRWQTSFKEWRTRFHTTYDDEVLVGGRYCLVETFLDRALAGEFDGFEAHIEYLRAILIRQCTRILHSAPNPEPDPIVLEIQRSLQDAANSDLMSAAPRKSDISAVSAPKEPNQWSQKLQLLRDEDALPAPQQAAKATASPVSRGAEEDKMPRRRARQTPSVGRVIVAGLLLVMLHWMYEVVWRWQGKAA